MDLQTFLQSQALGPNSKQYLTSMFLNPSTHDSSYGPYYEFDALK